MKPHFFRILAYCTLALMILGTAHAQQTDATNSIQSLTVAQQAAKTIVKVDLKQALNNAPASFSVANPARVVFDFSKTSNDLGRTLQEVSEGELRSINIIQVGDRTRLVLNLKKASNYQAQQEGNSLLITLSGTSGEMAAATPPVTPVVQHFAPIESTKTAATAAGSRSVR
jgi:type IV pilus assembly protein PilQ